MHFNGVMPSSELSCNIAAIFFICLVGCWLKKKKKTNQKGCKNKVKNQQQGTCGTWEWSVLFTELLPLGSAPESLMLSMRFITEAVVQVTTRQNTLKELIRLSLGILTELFFCSSLAFSAFDYLCEMDKLARGHSRRALILQRARHHLICEVRCLRKTCRREDSERPCNGNTWQLIV